MKKIKQRFNDFKIKTKLIVLLIIAGIVPLLFVSFYHYQVSKRNLLEQAYNHINTTSQQIVSNINDQLASILQTAYVLSEDFVLKEYLSKTYSTDYDFVQAYRYINHNFYNILSSNSKLSNICIYTDNTTLPSDGLFIKPIKNSDGSEFSWIETSSFGPGNLFFEGVHKTAKDDYVISLGTIFLHGTIDNAQGYLIIDFKEKALHSLFEKEAKKYKIYVLDQNGSIQSTQDKSLLGTSLYENLPPQSLPADNEVKIHTMNGQKTMIVTSELLNGWNIVMMAPLNTIIEGAEQSTRETLFVSLLCLGVAFLLILKISHYFSSRFTLADAIIMRIENNDFQIESVPHSTDEMGRMLNAIYKMAHNLDAAIQQNYVKEMQRKDAELTLLQSQINPHLLYNALTGISSLVLSGQNKEAASFTNHLSQFYKNSLNHGKRILTIAEEIAITEHYIAIQNTRFRGMFSFTWDVEECVLNKETLKLMIQPFIENIVNHAAGDDSQALRVVIKIYTENDTVVFSIEDNGIGMSAEKTAALLNPNYAGGYGIINVNERIKLQYGEYYGVSIKSRSGQGTTVVIRIPAL